MLFSAIYVDFDLQIVEAPSRTCCSPVRRAAARPLWCRNSKNKLKT